MKKKRGKFLTMCFALMPGAGHMYMGFMKTGLSLMTAFLVLVFLSSWLSLGPLLFILPLIWFYGFFDCLNKRFSSDEEFAAFEDVYLFSMDKLLALDGELFNKHRLLSGVALLMIGIYLLLDNILRSFSPYMSRELYQILYDFIRLSPQIIVGIAIISLGVRLILGKKRESDMNA